MMEELYIFWLDIKLVESWFEQPKHKKEPDTSEYDRVLIIKFL